MPESSVVSRTNSYSHLVRWVVERGIVEIGRDSVTGSFIRAADSAGTIWRGEAQYSSLEEALADCNAGLAPLLQAELVQPTSVRF